MCCPARHAPHACQQLAMFSFPTYRMIADFPIHCSMIFLISSRTARLDWARSSPCSTDRRTAYGNAEYGRSWQAAVLPLPDFCRFYSARPFRCHARWYDAQWSPRPPSDSWETSPEFLPAWFRPAPGPPLCGVQRPGYGGPAADFHRRDILPGPAPRPPLPPAAPVVHNACAPG